MKLKIIALLIFVTSVSYSQRCGGGTFLFEFYILNGQKQEQLQYEIFEFDLSKVDNGNDKIREETYASFVRDYENGIIINYKIGDEIGDKSDKLVNFLTKKKVNKKGNIDNGVLQFKTIETYNKPYILKISNSKITFFIVANIFGGCNRTTKIILKQIPEIVE